MHACRSTLEDPTATADGWQAPTARPVRVAEGAQDVAIGLTRTPPKDGDGDGLVDADDRCPDGAETKNGYADTDGCPDALGTVVVRVVGADGAPIAGAAVSAGGKAAGRTGADGTLRLTDVMPGTDVSVSATADGWEAPAPRALRIAEGSQDASIALSRTPPKDTDGDGIVDPDDRCADRAETQNGYADSDGCPDALGTVVVKVASADGTPIAGAAVTAAGKVVGRTGADGTLRLPEALPGTDLLLAASADGWEAPAGRTVRVGEGSQDVPIGLSRAAPKDTDGDGIADPSDRCADQAETRNGYADDDGCPDELATVVLSVLDPDGKAVVGASVSRDGRAIGRTDADGNFRLADLVPGGSVTLTVTPTSGLEPGTVTVTLTEGEVRTPVDLKRPAPRDADLDGIVDANDRCPDRPENKNGVADEDGCPEEFASVRLEVADAQGAPVAGAEIRGGGAVLGRTDASGVFVLADRIVGSNVVLDVVPPSTAALLSQTVEVQGLPSSGATRAVHLSNAGRGVHLIVKSSETGAGIPAMAVLFGPVEEFEGGNPVIDVRTGELVVEMPLGDDGEEVLDLPPGSWRVVLMGKDHLPEERSFVVAAGADMTIEVSLLPRRRGAPPAPPAPR